jgi:hypothetical protein
MLGEKRNSMGYIPKDAEWFLADLVEEIRVAGSRRNIVHINTVIFRATSPEGAYQRAMASENRVTLSYENPHGQKVTIRFRGLGNLDVIHDPLGDECEIMYIEKLGLSKRGIRKLVRPKRKLQAFLPWRERRRGRPDYSSAEVVKETGPYSSDQEMPLNTTLQAA